METPALHISTADNNLKQIERITAFLCLSNMTVGYHRACHGSVFVFSRGKGTRERLGAHGET